MKTILSIALVLFSFSNIIAEGFDYNYQEETYINDIPFDTHAVTSKIAFEKAINVQFKVEEESYVNDIPFDTHEVVEELIEKSILNPLPKMTEETYIDDIPFNTAEVAAKYLKD